MNRPIIIITVEFEKPARASSGVSIWHRRRASRAHKATMSDLNLPLTKRAAETRSIIIVAIIFRYAKRKAKIANPSQ